MEAVKLALDWTPNTNHIGFYVGLAKGWYLDHNIELSIQPPTDSYSLNETPGRKLVNGEVDLCIAPSESLISCWTSDEGKIRPIAIAAILSDDTSAIIAKKSKITDLKELDGKRYASYEGRFEMNIIRQMIQNVGGTGDITEVHPPKLDCYDAVLRDDADATWIFLGWEGIMAKKKGYDMIDFPLIHSGVPYGYSPLLLAHPKFLEKPDLVTKFLQITSQGYQYAVENPIDASECLLHAANHHTLVNLGMDFITESTMYLVNGNHYINPSTGKWGMMSSSRWSDFIDWLVSNKLLTKRDGELVSKEDLPLDEMYTNKYLL